MLNMSKDSVSGKSKLMKDKNEWSLLHPETNINERSVAGVDLQSSRLEDGVGSNSSVEYFNHNPTDPTPVFGHFKHNISTAGSVPKMTARRPVFFASTPNADQTLLYSRNNDNLTQNNVLEADNTTGNGGLPNLQLLSLGNNNVSYSTDQYTRQESVLSADGLHCATPTPSPSTSRSVPFSSSISVMSTTSSSSLDSSSSPSVDNAMQDFVVLHTDSDSDSVQSFRQNLISDASDDTITVDLFSEIDAGSTEMQSIATLHDRYRYILIFVTDNLVDDINYRFLNEILITLGLREGGSKADRVVPVFTKSGDCKILELSIIGGLQYYRRTSGSGSLHAHYLRAVKNLVQCARRKFPL